MKVFNEEAGRKAQVALVLDPQETRELIKALEAAYQQNKRRTKWKKLLKQLEAQADCY